MLKILQVRLQQYMNRELPDVQPRFRKARGARDKLPTSSGSLKKEESPRKTSAAAAKSLQLCPTLCDPIDGSPPGSPVPGILQASKKIKSDTVSTVSPSISHEVMGPDAMIFIF